VERAGAFDLFVESLETVSVALDGEVGNGPDDFPEEEHHCADVEELEPKALVEALHHFQAGCSGLIGFGVVVAALSGFDFAAEIWLEMGF